MSRICFNCHKKSQMSTKSQHHKGVAGGSWKHKAQKSSKTFKVNLKNLKVMLGDSVERLRFCTSCISKLRKDGRLSSGVSLVKIQDKTVIKKEIAKASVKTTLKVTPKSKTKTEVKK